MNARHLFPLVLAGLAACNGDPVSSEYTANPSSERLRVAAGVAINDAQQMDTAAAPTGLPEVITPVVRVSQDHSVELFQSTQVSSNVQLFGLPMSGLPVQWEAVSGTGIASFEQADATSTKVSFDTAGQYVIKMSATYQEQTAFDTLVITVTPPPVVNAAPIVNAGADRVTTLGKSILLNGQVADDGLPGGKLNITWQQFSGPAIATITDASSGTTAVQFDVKGHYIFELVANDSEMVARDRLSVVVNEPADEQPTGSEPVDGSDPETGDVSASAQKWSFLSNGGTEPDARHEAGAVAFNNRIYLLGGRGKRPVNEYNPNTERWTDLGTPSLEMHHFQPVIHENKIWVVGAMTCCFPREDVLERIQVFDPATKKWSQGPRIPANRLRGSAGAVMYKGKLYVVGGSTNGHDGGDVNWFDVYNPATDSWNSLADAPTSRDHASATVIDDKLIVAGGRQTDHPDTFANLVTSTDIYDFKTGKWSRGPNIPTPRAGAMTVGFGDDVVVAGGETERSGAAEKTVQAYNSKTGQWRTLPSLKEGRHSGGAAVLDGIMHVISGNGTRGGGDELSSHEVLNLN